MILQDYGIIYIDQGYLDGLIEHLKLKGLEIGSLQKDLIPILTDTGRYRASFVEGTSETIDERSALQWDYGSQTPYGIYHEEESSNLPIRSVIGELVENTGFQNWLNTEIEKYFAGIINV